MRYSSIVTVVPKVDNSQRRQKYWHGCRPKKNTIHLNVHYIEHLIIMLTCHQRALSLGVALSQQKNWHISTPKSLQCFTPQIPRLTDWLQGKGIGRSLFRWAFFNVVQTSFLQSFTLLLSASLLQTGPLSTIGTLTMDKYLIQNIQKTLKYPFKMKLTQWRILFSDFTAARKILKSGLKHRLSRTIMCLR